MSKMRCDFGKNHSVGDRQGRLSGGTRSVGSYSTWDSTERVPPHSVQIMLSLRGAQRRSNLLIGILALCYLFVFLHATNIYAFPFNDDMVNNNKKTGSFARPRDNRTVPLGSLGTYIPNREDALTLKNPYPPIKESLIRGERLFTINCTTCHGYYKDGKKSDSPVSTHLLGAPDLTLPDIAAKPDGHFFQYIHFGGLAIMPVYGYKFSLEERWNIVNFVRELQKNRKE